MNDVLLAASMVCTLLGLLCAATVLTRTTSVQLTLGVLLDFLLAAGLLRLAAHPGARGLASAALVVAIRKLAASGVSVGNRRLPAPTEHGTAAP